MSAARDRHCHHRLMYELIMDIYKTPQQSIRLPSLSKTIEHPISTRQPNEVTRCNVAPYKDHCHGSYIKNGRCVLSGILPGKCPNRPEAHQQGTKCDDMQTRCAANLRASESSALIADRVFNLRGSAKQPSATPGEPCKRCRGHSDVGLDQQEIGDSRASQEALRGI